MKTLFIGGVKSGKSRLAEKYTLELSKEPLYLATSEIIDDEMRVKVFHHQLQRNDQFETIEEPLNILGVVHNSSKTVLIECMTFWLNNMLYYNKSDEEILLHVKELLALENNIVFVLNDVGSGIIGADEETREFINLSGVLSQFIASQCDEVYHVIAGIGTQIK